MRNRPFTALDERQANLKRKLLQGTHYRLKRIECPGCGEMIRIYEGKLMKHEDYRRWPAVVCKFSGRVY